MSIIELKNITVKFKDLTVFKNFNLKIEAGEYIALVGPNGAGKTTLINVVSGIIPIKTGEYLLNDVQVTEKLLRKNVGMLFQNPDNQLIASIVKNDIAFGLENKNIKSVEQMDVLINDVLNKLDILDLKEKNVNSLSGGQKQKVALASIIVLDFNILIFDEATSMLDPYSQNEVINIMEQLHQEGKTIIHITHHMGEAKKAKRMIVLNEGKIIADAKPSKIFRNQEIVKKANLF